MSPSHRRRSHRPGGYPLLGDLERDHVVLGILTVLELVDGVESSHFPLQIHSAKAVQFADECQRSRMIDQSIAIDTSTMQSQQMLMPATDNGDQITGVLDLVGVTGGFLFDLVGTVGNGGGG